MPPSVAQVAITEIAVGAANAGVSATLVTVIVRACVADFGALPLSVTATVRLYTLSAPASAGASKSGAATKVSTPEVALMANFAASVPPSIAYVSVCAGVSASVAVTVVTAVAFSATEIAAVAPPPLLVMTGATLVENVSTEL